MKDLLLTAGTLTTFTVEAEDDIGDTEDRTGVIVKPDLLALRIKIIYILKLIIYNY